MKDPKTKLTVNKGKKEDLQQKAADIDNRKAENAKDRGLSGRRRLKKENKGNRRKHKI